MCTATLEPVEVATGAAAIHLTAALSENIGDVTTFMGPDASNLKLAEPAAIPRVPMANPDQPVRPIEMTPETNQVSFWLDTSAVTPGRYEIQLGTEERACTAQLTVTG